MFQKNVPLTIVCGTLAGETRFEHATRGFGDRCSTVEPLPCAISLIIVYGCALVKEKGEFMRYKLGVIGFGVMGRALTGGILTSGKLLPEEIIVFDVDKSKIEMFPYKVAAAESLDETANSERILLAVKPQKFPDIRINRNLLTRKTIISVMAGIKILSLREKYSRNNRFVRIMPNTPCRLGAGVMGMCFEDVSDAEKRYVIDLFSGCGEVVVTDEKNFDAVTSVSGSGPAYVYMFAEGMIKGGMDGGLSYEESKILALNTIIGSALLAKESDLPMDVLTDRVCSKGGTTAEAVKVFRERGLTDILRDGIKACREKSADLGEKK